MSNQPNKPSSLLDRLSKGAGGASVASSVAAVSTADIKTINVDATGGTRVNRPTTDVLIQPRMPEHVQIVKPKKTSADQVLFAHPSRPNFGTVLSNGERVRFQHGFLLTSDKTVIEYLRTNAKHFGLHEEQDEKKEAEKK